MPTAPITPPPPAKRRIVCLIDGFNLYHAIDDCPHYHAFKWLNPIALARAYIMPSKDALVATFFFTALPPWSEKKRRRHQLLLDIYEDLGVIVKPGMFKKVTVNCRGTCGQEFETYDEKQTDINIALEIMRMGRDDIADCIFLVTGDNDQTSSIKEFRSLYPNKEVVVILPPWRKANELTSAANRQCALSGIQLGKSQLPDPYCFTKTQRDNADKPEHWVNAPPPSATWRPRETERKHKCDD